MTPIPLPEATVSPAKAGTVIMTPGESYITESEWYNEGFYTAVANPGYRFVEFTWDRWYVYETGPSSFEHETFPFPDPIISQRGYKNSGTYGEYKTYITNLVAIFEVDPDYKYSVVTQSAPIAGGATRGDGSYAAGSMVTIEATANTGYLFKNWISSQGETSLEVIHTFPMPSTDITWTANFEAYVPPVIDHLIIHSHSTFTIRQKTGKFILRDA